MMMIKLLNVISRIPIIHLLPIYLCTNSSWNVRAAICPEGRLSSLVLWSVYSPTVDGSWSSPFTSGRGVGTENDSLYEYIYIYIYIYIYTYIYICAFGSLILDVTCNYVSADGGRDGLWWPALLGHWLSYTGCWQSLLVIYWLMIGMLFLFLTTSLGCFSPRTLLFE